MTKEQSSGASKMLDTTREAVERLARAYDINAGEVMHSDTSHTADTLRALLTRAETAEAERDALEALVRQAINEDDGRYFEVNPFHVQALRALGDDEHLDPLDQPKEGKDDE